MKDLVNKRTIEKMLEIEDAIEEKIKIQNKSAVDLDVEALQEKWEREAEGYEGNLYEDYFKEKVKRELQDIKKEIIKLQQDPPEVELEMLKNSIDLERKLVTSVILFLLFIGFIARLVG